MHEGLTLTTGGTDNHLMVVDLRPQGVIGNIAAEALEEANIVVNRNSVPHDPNPPFYPSGIRLGTPAITTRGMKEKDMKQIGTWIAQVIRQVSHYRLPESKDARQEYLTNVRSALLKNTQLQSIRRSVIILTKRFPVP
jgi:glycine hydroxymethyltransferase